MKLNMKKFIQKLYHFMYGRYGIDELYQFCIVLYFVLIVVNIFMRNYILSLLELLLFLIIMYRFLSKNITRRQKENQKYLQIKRKMKKRITQLKRRWNDRWTHMYKKCPHCKTTLRLPLKKGTHTVKCPKCSTKFSVKCRKNEKVKVDIIKNK